MVSVPLTAAQLVERLPNARRTGRGWTARCPAHDDSGPSLSIADGNDGRTLVKCFAGCDVDRIVATLGLKVHDLFERDNSSVSRPMRTRRKPTPAEIRAELDREAAAFREQHAVHAGPGNELLPSEMHSIRQRVAARLGITLPAIPRTSWEGNYGGRERDPCWPVIFERAWEDLWLERGERPPYTLAECAAQGRTLSPRILILVEDRAAAIHRDFVAKQGPA